MRNSKENVSADDANRIRERTRRAWWKRKREGRKESSGSQKRGETTHVRDVADSVDQAEPEGVHPKDDVVIAELDVGDAYRGKGLVHPARKRVIPLTNR